MKIRYAALAATVAALNLVGNGLYLFVSEATRVTLIISENGLGVMRFSKWILLLFAASALAFVLAYIFMRVKRARRGQESPKAALEDRTVLIASVAVALMGWIASLLLL